MEGKETGSRSYCVLRIFLLRSVFFRHGTFDLLESVPYKILVEQFNKRKTTITTAKTKVKATFRNCSSLKLKSN